jgi:Flp pilus assembly protein TadD
MDAKALHGLGRVRQAEGDVDGARKLWTESLETDAQFVPALTDLGSLALLDGNAARAVDLYKRAVVSDPNSRAAHHGLGLAYQLTGEHALARVHLAKSQELP